MRSQHGDPEALVAHLASTQMGLFTREQAISCGMSAATVRRRTAAGRWAEVLPGVLRISGAPTDHRQRVLASLMWAGEDSVASHRCAALLQGWDGFKEPIVEITATRRLQQRNGIVAHQRAALAPADVSTLGPIRITHPARTLLDLGAVADERSVEAALEHALRRGHVSIPRLRWQLETAGGMGVRGARTLKRLLEARPLGYRPVRSHLELKVRRCITEAGLPPPVFEYPVRLPNGRIVHPDFAYPDLLLAIECESYEYHSGRTAWRKDIERYGLLRQLGWTVIQVTHDMVEPDPSAFLADLGSYLQPTLWR